MRQVVEGQDRAHGPSSPELLGGGRCGHGGATEHDLARAVVYRHGQGAVAAVHDGPDVLGVGRADREESAAGQAALTAQLLIHLIQYDHLPDELGVIVDRQDACLP